MPPNLATHDALCSPGLLNIRGEGKRRGCAALKGKEGGTDHVSKEWVGWEEAGEHKGTVREAPPPADGSQVCIFFLSLPSLG